ncbi:MAG: glycosyltransferase [Acidimicrobiales bacterium]|jgi:glycosyltransferase involved in cell wall biosynthesis
MTSRPVRIDQVIPSIVERDAVSHHTLEAQHVLRSMGFVSEIFADNWGPGLNGRVHPLAELPREPGGGQWVCYQASIGSPAAEVVAAHPGRKIVNYHNITPAEHVEAWMPSLGEEVRLGRRQLAELAPLCELGIGVSRYNAAELDAWGYRRTAVAPLMMDLSALDVTVDPRLRAELEVAKETAGSDWLFVGQMLPHKAHQDVVKAFACFLDLFDPNARLHLVGRPSCSPYALAVRRFAEAIGIAAAVDFAGSVSAAELSAYYLAADVLVCCSEHEGFCAPLLEAMHYGVPVVAYGTAAVPETVLDAGIVLGSKTPVLVATAAERVLSDPVLRAVLIDRGRERAREFTLEAARQGFSDAIEQLLATVS